MLKVTHRDPIDRALAEVDTPDVDDAIALLEDDDTVFVDLRDPRVLEREGKVPNAFHAPRGMLEFWVDPRRPTTKRYSPRANDWFFTAKADGARRWLPRRYKTWDSSVFVT